MADLITSPVVVYSALFGDYADASLLMVPHPIENVRWMLFTDAAHELQAPGWEIIRTTPVSASPRRSSRHMKICPELYFNADASVYIDARVVLTCDPVELVEACSNADAALWVHKHRLRSCIFDEGRFILHWHCLQSEVQDKLLMHQLHAYAAGGLSLNAGLFELGFIVRKHTPAVRAFGETWWRLYSEGCERDQVSFVPAALEAGIKLGVFTGTVTQSNICFLRSRPGTLER
jgi:hypothetical protein